MNYNEAVAFLSQQERNLKKVNNTRFEKDGYEYRIKYEGGFAAFVAIERRQIGKRKFEYFTGFGAHHCWNVGEVLTLAQQEISKKLGVGQTAQVAT